MDYKIILCGKGFYQEVELKEDCQRILIGTSKGCDVRFNKTRVPQDFELSVEKTSDRWIFNCLQGVSFSQDASALKMIVPELGERIYVYSSTDNSEMFSLDYYEDFGLKTKDYDLRISYASCDAFTIGGESSTIRIMDDNVGHSILSVKNLGNSLLLDIQLCRTGVSVNGVPVMESTKEVFEGDFFSLCGYQFFVYNKELYTSRSGDIVTSLHTTEIEYQKNHFTYPKFVKNSRQQYTMPESKLEILPPSAKPAKDNKNFILTLAPMLVSLVVMVGLRGTMGGNVMFVLYSGVTILMGIIMSIITHNVTQKEYKKKVAKREEVYREYLAKQEAKIVNMRNREYAVACHNNPSVQESVEMVAQFSSRLFEKKKEHSDYLVLRLGKGVVRSLCQVDYKEEEYVETDDYLADYPRSISEKYEYIQDMPVLLDLKEVNAVGLVGTRTKLYQMAKNIIISISTQHFYQDVKFFYLLESGDEPYFMWTRWLRNSRMDQVGLRNYIYDEKSQKIILDFLYTELSQREALGEAVVEMLSNIVVFVYRSEQIRNHPINNFVKKAQKLGFTFLFFEEYEEFLNDYCDKIIYLSEQENKGKIQDIKNGQNIQEFEYEHIPGDVAAQMALKLACTYIDEVSLEENLTKNITLYELLGIMSASDLELAERWKKSEIYKTMAAPLGVKTGNEKVYLDLHEKYHGPHGLVAGTTGSGKSEILQSYILSMATLYHPYEVGFIIIDFKGGGMVNQFRDLPHLNGAITNIDGREIERSLLSIRAELRKRQEYFAEYKVNHINDYIKLYKQGEAKIPLPHLILIVDEFAELKSDQPEFMKELISAARIGRSLGVHLILATQKPSGVVNEQIWSNSKFKLCLKVQNVQDSNEVLKSPLAAEIREPGRAYLQVGNNEIFQLFQSAYSGAPANVDTLGNQKKYKISKVNLVGQKEVIFEKKIPKQEGAETQLSAVVQHVAQYCADNNIKRLPNICLPPLGENISYENTDYASGESDIVVPIGIYDDPSRQLQAITGINITQSHTFILGASQYGKTNLLQTVIKGLAERYTPQEVNIYILDFASMILRNFEKLAHVGGVVTSRDDEKMKNFIKMMEEIIATRKDILSKYGLSSYSAYREAGYGDMPQIVVIVDGTSAFRELYPAYEDIFSVFCRDGLAVGFSVIATNTQTGGMGLRFLTNFATRIGFTCNNSSEYTTLFERCKISPKEVPGRCLIQSDKEIYECQIYLSFEGEKEIERTSHMKEFIDEKNIINADYGCAKRIPVIPEVVTEEYVQEQLTKPCASYEIPIGINFANTEVVYLNLQTANQIGILDRGTFGKNNLLYYIIKTLQSNDERNPVEMHIVDSIDKNLEYAKAYEFVKSYSLDCGSAVDRVKEIYQCLEERYQMLLDNKLEELMKQPLIILMLNAKEAYASISGDKSCLEMYKQILNKFKTLKVLIVLSDMENASLGYGANEVVKQLKEGRMLFIFEDLSEQKVVDVPMQVLRDYKKKLNEDEAYMFINNDITKVKTVVCRKSDKKN